MLRRISIAAAAALLSLVALPVRAEQWTKVYKITGRPDVRVTTNDAAIEVSAGDAKEVAARVITNNWAISPDEVRIERDVQNGNSIELEVRVPRLRWSWGDQHRSVHIELTVPREANLNLHSGDGHIRVNGVKGEEQIETSDGSIEVSNLGGTIRLHSGDGHIEASGMDGSLDASTNDGHLRVRGRFDSLRLETGDGSVTADVLQGSRLANNWSIHTGDGSVTVRLSDGISADLEAHTRDGSISSQLPLMVSGILGRKDLRGKLGGGGPTLQIRTGDGSIRLERL
jgi:putative adhesin